MDKFHGDFNTEMFREITAKPPNNGMIIGNEHLNHGHILTDSECHNLSA